MTTVGAGDSHFIPSGAPHALRCIEKGSYLLATLPGTSGADDREHDHDHAGHEHAGHRR